MGSAPHRPILGGMGAAAAETHISVVLFLGERAYKFPKPVRFPFLDQSTPALRREACEREVALNRRLAPDVYLGVAELALGDGRSEPCVAMRRLPADRRLSTLVVEGGGADEVRAVARRLAAFHAEAERSDHIDAAGDPEAVLALWEGNLAEMAVDPATAEVADELERVGELARRYLTGRAPLLRARQEGGLIRDGHGDLLADDVFCLDDGPRVLDCLAFADDLRHGDVLLDVAFLAMDLERLGAADLAQRFLDAYVAFGDEHHPRSLAEHYVAYRALVRAKVAFLRVPEGGDEARAEAEARLGQSLRHLEAARVRLVLVGGPPATGKTTLATALADERGWVRLATDEVRKEQAGRAWGETSEDGLDQGLYAPERSQATYEEVLDRAGVLLSMGESVVLDASWATGAHRSAAATLAERAGADLVALRCTASPATVTERAERRLRDGGDPSDAGPEIALSLAERFEPWSAATAIDTDQPLAVGLARAQEVLG